MIEVHPNPAKALSDGPQSLTPDRFDRLMQELAVIGKGHGRWPASVCPSIPEPGASNEGKEEAGSVDSPAVLWSDEKGKAFYFLLPFTLPLAAYRNQTGSCYETSCRNHQRTGV